MICPQNRFSLNRNFLLFIGFFILIIIEFCAYQWQGKLSFIASRLWLLHGSFYVLCSLGVIVKTLKKDFQERNFRGLLIFFLFGLVLFHTVGSRGITINHESTQQVADGCGFFKQPDFSYTKIGFLGYPARQYLLLALPSLMFGRSLITLRLPYAAAFFLGVMLFYCGLNRYFDERKTGRTLLAPFVTLSLLCFPVLVSILISFEQAVLPLSFTLQATGWFLLCLKTITRLRAVCLAFIGALLATAYTPGLASWGLLIVLLGVQIWREGRLKDFNSTVLWINVLLFAGLVGAFSFFTRIDLFSRESGLWIPHYLIGPYLLDVFKALFIPFEQAFLPVPVVIYFMLSLMSVFRRRDFAVSLWAMLTIFLATQLGGFAKPAPPYSLHRALVIIPPLLTSMALTIESWVADKGVRVLKRVVFFALCLGVLFAGKNLYESLKLCRSGPRDVVIFNVLDAVEEFGVDKSGKMRILVAPGNLNYSNLYDCFRYFLPKSEFLWHPTTVGKLENMDAPAFVYLDRPEWRAGIMDMMKGGQGHYAIIRFHYDNKEIQFLRIICVSEKNKDRK